MKPRRPAIKDSVKVHPAFARRKSDKVAAKAARRAAAKKRKEAEVEKRRAAEQVASEVVEEK